MVKLGTVSRPLRLARWSGRLLRYDFTVVHKPGKSNAVADVLPRLPVDCSFTDDDSYVVNALFDNLSAFAVDEVDNASKQDQVLIKVSDFITNGCPRRNVMDEKLLPYFAVRNDLHCWSKYSVGRNAAIVMPESLYSKALQLAHEDHFGIVRSKHQLRSFAWWPKCSAMLEQLVHSCSACCEIDRAQVVRDDPHEKIITADEKFTTINIDISGPYNDAPSNFKYLLHVVDENSRWPEVFALDNTHAKQIVMSLKDYFARFGVPELVRCDEGSLFTSAEFKTFIIHQGVAVK